MPADYSARRASPLRGRLNRAPSALPAGPGFGLAASPVPRIRGTPPGVIRDSELARLLEHPAIWRGRSAARTEAVSTGFETLDECLPGRGWPRSGLIEILVPRFGVGELSLLLPALAALTRRPTARWCVWVTPPLEPFAPALAAHGVLLEKILIARAGTSLWAFEQSLGSGACDVVMAWARRLRTREIRRLQLAAERGRTLGILFRSQSAVRESSPAILRMAVEPLRQGARVTLLKSRGGRNGSIEIGHLPAAGVERPQNGLTLADGS